MINKLVQHNVNKQLHFTTTSCPSTPFAHPVSGIVLQVPVVFPACTGARMIMVPFLTVCQFVIMFSILLSCGCQEFIAPLK